jgi:hypothetical protein
MNDNLKSEWKRIKSDDYRNLFANIIFFEKILKSEYARFIDDKTPYGRLGAFFSNLKKFRRKRRERIKKISNFYKSANSKIGYRSSLTYDLGYVDGGFYDGEWSEGYAMSNLHELKIYDLVNLLTFGEFFELIMSFKTREFLKFLKMNNSCWNFNFDTFIIFILNILDVRNKLCHGSVVGFKNEKNVYYKRNHKLSFLISRIELITRMYYNN